MNKSFKIVAISYVLLCAIACGLGIYSIGLVYEDACPEAYTVSELAKPIERNTEYATMPMYMACTQKGYSEVTLAETKVPEDEVVMVDSVTMQCGSGPVEVEPVTVNVTDLVTTYNNEEEYPEWDYKKKIQLINTLWEFLVNQQHVEEHNAAAIIGVVCFEGNFGEHQGDYAYLTSIEDVRGYLGNGGSGYGIAQWTYHTRQDNLESYYELACELYPDDFETASIIAECCMLLRELEVYNIFDDFSNHTTIEDTVGRLSCQYERYSNHESQWSQTNGVYRLVSTEGSGSARLAYANHIYEHFMGGV